MDGPRPLNERIRERRKAKGWTQDDAARRIGVSQPTWSTWEVGTSQPSGDNVKRLRDVLGLTAADIATPFLTRDEVEQELWHKAELRSESRDALIAIYRRVLEADIASDAAQAD